MNLRRSLFVIAAAVLVQSLSEGAMTAPATKANPTANPAAKTPAESTFDDSEPTEPDDVEPDENATSNGIDDSFAQDTQEEAPLEEQVAQPSEDVKAPVGAKKANPKKPNDKILNELRESLGSGVTVEEVNPYEDAAEASELRRREMDRQQTERLRKSLRKDVQLVEISPYSTGPFNERRPKWTSIFSLFYSRYSPLDYIPNLAPSQGTLKDYYKDVESPLAGFTFDIKRNLSWISAFVQLGAGSYYNSASDGASLSLTPIMVGFGIALDAFFSEPYLVPYAIGGAYTVLYREASAGSAGVNGRTTPSAFMAAGLKVQLDWIDTHGDQSGYDDVGLENTYLFIEVRQFLSNGARDFDFKTPAADPYQWTAGLSLEF